MNITEILSPHVKPGAVLVDLTSPASELSAHVRFPPALGVSRQTAWPVAPPAAGALVLQHLPATRLTATHDARVELAADDVAPGTVHVVFVDETHAIYEHGLLDAAAAARWEISSVHATGHAVYRIAIVLMRAASDAGRAPLRVINEWRLGKWIQREQERELERLDARLQKALATEAQLAEVLRARNDELAQLRGSHDESVQVVEARADRALEVAEKARSSLSFRVARATRVALRESASSPLTLPTRWLSVFRGPDEIVEGLRGPDGRKRGRRRR